MDFLKINWAVIVLVALVAAFIGVSLGTNGCPMCAFFESGHEESRSAAAVTENGKTLQWTAKTLDGSSVSSESMKGKVSVLIYWATWCSPCRQEIPDLVTLRNEFSSEQVSIIGVSTDSPGKDLKSFIEKNSINYSIVRHNESLEKAFGQVTYMPTMFILDRDGRLKHQYAGVVGKEAIRDQIRALLD